MASPRAVVLLPESVDQIIDRICAEQNQTQPDASVRRRLASIDENTALQLLHQISRSKIRNLSAYIIFMLSRPPFSSSSPSSTLPPRSPDVSLSSPNWSPSSSSASPNYSIKRYFSAIPQSKNVVRSLIMERPTEIGRACLEVLGELEFRKQFMILNYSGGKELSSVISVDEIQELKHLPMVAFEKRVWERIGKYRVDKEDRRTSPDWDPSKTHIYHCHVSPDGSYTFKGPFLNKKRTHLQKVLGDDNVVVVRFAEDATKMGSNGGSSGSNYAVYEKILKEGILVGLRRYQFFVFKDGGKEEKKKNPTSSPVKCYFVQMESDAQIDRNVKYSLSNKTIYEARCVFMHAHTVSSINSYMARLSLILSKTVSLPVDLSSIKIERKEDKYCLNEFGECIYRDGKPLIHTDGTGFISEDLASLCSKNLLRGESINDGKLEIIHKRNKHEEKDLETKHLDFTTQEPPLLMQIRLFNKGCAVKGTLLLNKKLLPKTILIRDSMVKVETDPKLSSIPTANSLEIVTTSNPPKRTYLSRYLIALLCYGGVPKEYFMDVLLNALEDAQNAFGNKRAAYKAVINHAEIDDDSNVARMILSGIPLEESYLQHRIFTLMEGEMKNLKFGKLYVPCCFYLMGTADPTGTLEKDEVCIVLENGQVSWEKVLVYRNPGLHFGDIHVLKATYKKELESVIGNARYSIFFSCKGPRSVADEIAGGDYDGDMYWVSKNPQLLEHFKPSEPWIPDSSSYTVESKRPDELSAEKLEDELVSLFLRTRFKPSFSVSEAADSWLTLMDRLLLLGDASNDEKCLVKAKMIQLVDLYYNALDAPKKGARVEVPKELSVKMYPHYLDQKQNTYISTSILGLIYDTVNSYQAEDHSNIEIQKLPFFDVEVPQACRSKWENYYTRYKFEMTCTLQNNKDRETKDEAAKEVIRNYKKLLYDAEEFEESTRNLEEIFEEALAIYNVNYEYAMRKGEVSRCGFAWKVAGSALIKLYLRKQEEKPFLCSPSVLREIF